MCTFWTSKAPWRLLAHPNKIEISPETFHCKPCYFLTTVNLWLASNSLNSSPLKTITIPRLQSSSNQKRILSGIICIKMNRAQLKLSTDKCPSINIHPTPQWQPTNPIPFTPASLPILFLSRSVSFFHAKHARRQSTIQNYPPTPHSFNSQGLMPDALTSTPSLTQPQPYLTSCVPQHALQTPAMPWHTCCLPFSDICQISLLSLTLGWLLVGYDVDGVGGSPSCSWWCSSLSDLFELEWIHSASGLEKPWSKSCEMTSNLLSSLSLSSMPKSI